MAKKARRLPLDFNGVQGIPVGHKFPLREQLQMLESENARLREALAGIAGYTSGQSGRESLIHKQAMGALEAK